MYKTGKKARREQLRRQRSLKIVATLGPASSTYDTIKALFEAGADVFRLNMSHGAHDDIRVKHQIIRDIERDLGRPIGILADLQGPKLRCGVFANDTENLVEGQDFRFDLDDTPGDAKRVNLPHKEIFAALEPNTNLLVNDGKIRLKVNECGLLILRIAQSKWAVKYPTAKAVNVPDVVLPVAAPFGKR